MEEGSGDRKREPRNECAKERKMRRRTKYENKGEEATESVLVLDKATCSSDFVPSLVILRLYDKLRHLFYVRPGASSTTP